MSKTIVEGKIAKIFVKDFEEVDQYGNQYGVNININDQWYGLGKKKKPAASVKIGTDWHQLTEGDYIEAVATSREYNDKTYYNIRSSDITVKEKGNGGGASGNSSSANSGGGNPVYSSQPVSGDRQSAIMRQSAMGYAAQIVAGTLTSKSDLDQAASDVVRIAAEYFVPYAEHGVTADETRKKEENEVKNQQAAQASDDDDDGQPFDDAIPF
jgi:hypothetical protein